MSPTERFERAEGVQRRVNIMMRHTYLITIAVVLLCAGIGGVAYYLLTLPQTLRFAVGPANSDDVRVAQAIAAQLKDNRAGVRLQIDIVDGGPAAASAAIDKGLADLAVVRRDVAMPKDGQVVAILRKNVVVFIVPSAAAVAKVRKSKGAATKAREPVDKIGGLVGRRLAVIGRSGANIELLKTILRQYNIAPDKLAMLTAADLAKPIEPDKIGVYQIEVGSVSPAIRDNNFDAIMAVGPISSPITAEAISAATRGKDPPTFLKIDAAEAIAERSPFYESSEIKAGALGGSPARPEESVDTIEVAHYIVAYKKIHDSIIADFTKQLFLIRAALASELPAAAKIEKPDTDKDAAVPVHPGAAAYFDGEIKSFFDRYSDLIYWGLMGLSFFGSAFAGLLSYGQADDRVSRLRPLERLSAICREARNAESLAALQALQDEVDAIHFGMIRDVEENTLDETSVAAYGVSFQQAESALSDRRATLQNGPSAARPAAETLKPAPSPA
jgi:TRAP-type uncharacterized transport system substrate-binding protein